MKQNLWHHLFLEERPSISLAFFRLAVAAAVGAYVIPTFFPLADNYLSTAFKDYNTSFFPVWFLKLVQQSPDPLVIVFVALFCAAWLCFLMGRFTQISCIVMTAGCYYFYALNDFALGTLTWDILIVTLFLMCVTPYPGDYFSADGLVRRDPDAYKIRRPFFLQRLLQMQIAFIYFYTGLYKVTGSGNWLTDNPIHYLMLYPPAGVTKTFLLKDFLAGHPQLCYWIGVLIVAIELAMPALLFWRKTRLSAVYLGFVFHVVLILTLDVPSIFFFLFPAQLLLFIHPDEVLRWIEQKRIYNAQPLQAKLVYDGNCQFCLASVAKLQIMDLFGVIRPVNYQTVENIKDLHPQLTTEAAHSQLHLIEPDGTLYGGFDVFRLLCWTMPMMYPLIAVLYFPGSGIAGPAVYRWVAKNRYLFHANRKCQANACFRA